jgi:F-type H+-transporting ATPase subunit epsilon
MKFQIVTPLEIIVDRDGVTEVQAEDSTGSFEILEHHAAFITVLAVTVISWREGGGPRTRVAVRGGLLRVSGGLVLVATQQAVISDSLEALGPAVEHQLWLEEETESGARRTQSRLHFGLIRQIERYLEAGTGHWPVPGRVGEKASILDEAG